jgi:hypothetical protein
MTETTTNPLTGSVPIDPVGTKEDTGELTSEEIKQMYPDFTSDDVEAFAIHLSLKKRKFKVFQRLADA